MLYNFASTRILRNHSTVKSVKLGNSVMKATLCCNTVVRFYVINKYIQALVDNVFLIYFDFVKHIECRQILYMNE